jgi:cysteinyl-tRNA synthetase
MGLEFFNTMERRVVPFESIRPGEVGMYTCGPTVYNYAHIGNFRAYMFEDLLRRTLEFFGYRVKQVMNLTDVARPSVTRAPPESRSGSSPRNTKRRSSRT